MRVEQKYQHIIEYIFVAIARQHCNSSLTYVIEVNY
jgi:hypothetical protein